MKTTVRIGGILLSAESIVVLWYFGEVLGLLPPAQCALSRSGAGAGKLALAVRCLDHRRNRSAVAANDNPSTRCAHRCSRMLGSRPLDSRTRDRIHVAWFASHIGGPTHVVVTRRPTLGCTGREPLRYSLPSSVLLRVAVRADEPQIRWAAEDAQIQFRQVVNLLSVVFRMRDSMTRHTFLALLYLGALFGCDRITAQRSREKDSMITSVATESSSAPATKESAVLFSSARTPFEKKRACAEEGRRYFDRIKRDLRPTLPSSYLDVNGPVFAYNAVLDTCLCEYEIHETDLENMSKKRWDAGWIDDVFTNLPVAMYSESIQRDGSLISNGMMTRDEFRRRSNELTR
jgi:hypothetical protein